MHSNTRIRAVMAAAVAGTALAAVPAFADAATFTVSGCTYNPDNHNVIVTDLSGGNELRLLRGGVQGKLIMIADSFDATPTICQAPGVGTVADVENTERIAIFAAPQHVPGGYRIDQNNGRFAPGLTKETDGDSEVEIALNTTGVPADLTVDGTPQRDVISIGTGGRVNFAYDADADVEPQTAPKKVLVHGGVGNDEIDSNGGGIFSSPANVEVDMAGDAGNDSIVHSGLLNSVLRGGIGEDRLFSANGHVDGLTGGPGFDTATVDKFEGKFSFPFHDVEQIRVLDGVGRLRLAPSTLDVDAGKSARLELSWTHPKAWKQLRTVKLRVSQGADALGTITVQPGSGRMRGDGAVQLIARDSKLSHRGKTVTASLAVRLNRSLAGEDLRVDVQASDRNGRTQDELQAGVIRVAE